MKKATGIFSWILIVVMLLTKWVDVHADGMIIPEPPICLPPGCVPKPLPMQQLEIKYHHVEVKIDNQLVTTRVDQVFYNPNDYEIEGMYVFPLPLDATVSQFVLWIDGKPVEGQLLDAGEARRMYEEIVRQMIDPALLEYVGRGAMQASIYPIPPQGERRIELEYQQVLTAENGLVRYQYPLNTEKFSATPLQSVSIDVSIQSSLPIRAVYSPSHPVAVERDNDRKVTASYEASGIRPDTDFLLYFSTGKNEAFHVLSYLDPQDPTDSDGYFLMMLAPQIGGESEIIPKDVVLVLDRSGSMEGEKFTQAQSAMTYILEHLQEKDRFYVLAFSSISEAFSNRLLPASQANEAVSWIQQLSAMGSTDIDGALMEAASAIDPKRPTYLIFLTDGLPTRGITDSQQILANAANELPDGVRLFPFGVGYDVDTFLLDSLALAQHGISTYVQPGENLDERLSMFYEKISTPVLTNLSIEFDKLQVYDVFPHPLPDLFEGNQVIVTGRYRQGGTIEVVLSGEANGETQQYRYPETRFADGERLDDRGFPSLPRLWATRKIGYLLNEIRLNGPDQETIDQIVRLSLRYGIVTPYTSFLVTEDMPMGAAEQSEAARDAYNQTLAQPTPSVFGADAVQKAAESGAMSQAEQAAPPAVANESQLRQAGNRTYVLKGNVWTDTTYDPAAQSLVPVQFMSDEYFQLAAQDQQLADAFAVGVEVIVVYQGKAIQVLPAGSTSPQGDLGPLLQPTDPTSITQSSDPTSTSVPVIGTEYPNSTTQTPPSNVEGAKANWPRGVWIGLAGLGVALGLLLVWKVLRRPKE